MSDSSGFTAPGSSSYTSNTLHVGDGTWDTERNTFLLPNLMGVNFETMRYNGMGNRFRDMPHYQTLIIAHGVIAAIVFLGLVPLSVFIIRYYSLRNPYNAFRYHVWCQVLTLFLSTVVFVLGWFAVGPNRSLTNPHHGIGLAIYVIIVFQVLWGFLVHKIEYKKKRFHVPLKLVIHRWLGRALAILGIVQIPLGLTLYGSPKALFILYAVAAFLLLAIFFYLSYKYDSDRSAPDGDYDSRYSYVSHRTDDDHGHGGLGRMAAAGAAGAGLVSFLRRRNRDDASDGTHTSYRDEKYSDEEPRGGGRGTKIMRAVGFALGAFLAKNFMNRRRGRESDAESGRYRPAHGRADSMTEDSLSRLDDRPPPRPAYPAPLNRPPSRPPSRPQSPNSSYYDYSYFSHEDEGPPHTARNALLGAGAFAAVKNIFSRRKKDEQHHVEELRRHDRHNEKIARAGSKRRYTGDGYYPQRKRPASQTATELSTELSPHPPRRPYAPESALSEDLHGSGPVDPARSDVPPVPPVQSDDASSMTPTAPAPRPPMPPPLDSEGRPPAGIAHGGPPGPGGGPWRRDDRVGTSPVSIKVKMHEDGRNVTLRRLTEEEAAASRAARRRGRRSSRRRNGSVSSLSGNEGTTGSDRWRRVEELERQQHEQMLREQAAAAAAAGGPPLTSGPPLSQPPFAPGPPPPGNMPPPSSFMPPPNTSHPPPQRVPSTNPYGSITSPGTYTGTDMSGDYANNRRRRRAERARSRQERQGHNVEFT